MKTKIIFKVAIFLFIAVVTIGCRKELKGDLIIKNVNIIDVKTGAVNMNMDVVILGDSIADIVEYRNNTFNALQVIDGENKYLIPGLWDMHTHTWWGYKDFFPLLIANGVTGVREMFGNMAEVEKIRQGLKEGTIIGPEIVSPGPIVDGKPAAHAGSDEADTPEKGREIVRKQKADGADFIKVYSRLERDVYFAIADECNKLGIPFSGHIPSKVSLEEALEAGHETIEHFYGILEFCSSEKDYLMSLYNGEIKNDTLIGPGTYYNRVNFEINSFDASREEELAALMGENNAWVCPTLVVHKGWQRNIDPSYIGDKRVAYMPEYTMNGWDLLKDSDPSPENLSNLELEKKWYDLIPPLIKPLQDNGTNFLAGTDYSNPYTFAGFSIHEELELFVKEAGLTPLEALRTATLNPAIFLRTIKKAGTIDIGKNADLVLLSANPLEDISNTKKIDGVILKGKYHLGKALKEHIDKLAKKYSLPKIREVIKPIILQKGIEAGVQRYKELRQDKPNEYNFDEEQLNSLGYELLELKKILEAVRVFELNLELFSDYANGYDSLGDGYLAAVQKKKAIAIWAKAIEMGNIVTKGKLEELKNEK